MVKKIKILIALAYIALGIIVAFTLENSRVPDNQKLLLGIIISSYGIFRLVRILISCKNLK